MFKAISRWFARRAETKRKRNDWVLVHQIVEDWSYSHGTKKYKIIVNLFENVLGERKYELHSTCKRGIKHRDIKDDYTNQSCNYMKIIDPWLQGTRFAKIPCYNEAKEQVYEERIVHKLTDNAGSKENDDTTDKEVEKV